VIPSSPIAREPIENWHVNPRLVSGRANKQAQQQILTQQQLGIPQPILNLTGVKTSQMIGAQKWIRVTLSHAVNAADQAFSHAQVWAKNYLGNPNYQLISGSETSPHTLLLPPTGDNVTFAVRSIGRDGSLSPLAQSPVQTLQLS
jgi:hypothetical protein